MMTNNSFFTKIKQKNVKSVESNFDEIADTENKDWIVRFVGDSEIEYIRLFRCKYNKLYLKIIEDNYLRGIRMGI